MTNWNTGTSNYAKRRQREQDLLQINKALESRKANLKASRGFADSMEQASRTVGTIAGTVIGAVVGSVVPVVGTAAGAVAGAGVGNLVGGGAFDLLNKSQEELMGDVGLGKNYLGYNISSQNLGVAANKYATAGRSTDTSLIDANTKANTRHVTKPIGAMARQLMLNKLAIGKEAAAGNTATSNAAFKEKFPNLLKNTKMPGGTEMGTRQVIVDAANAPPTDISSIIAGGNPQASAEALTSQGFVQGSSASAIDPGYQKYADMMGEHAIGQDEWLTANSANNEIFNANASNITSLPGGSNPVSTVHPNPNAYGSATRIKRDADIKDIVLQNKKNLFVKDALDWNVNNKISSLNQGVVGGPDAFNARATAKNLEHVAARQVAEEEGARLGKLAELKASPYKNLQLGAGEHADDNYLKKRSLFGKWQDVWKEEKIRREEMKFDKDRLKPRFKGSKQYQDNATEVWEDLRDTMGDFEDMSNTVDSQGLQDDLVAVPVTDFKTEVQNTGKVSRPNASAIKDPGISLDPGTMDPGLRKSIQDSTLDSYNPATHQQYVTNLNAAPSIDGFMKKAGVGNVLEGNTINGNWVSTKGQYQAVFDNIMTKYFKGIPSNAQVLKEGRWKNILVSLHPDGQEIMSMIEKLEEAGEIVIPFK